jgi:hypothetical protein
MKRANHASARTRGNGARGAAGLHLKSPGPQQDAIADRGTIKELKIVIRAHYGVGQGLCPLCGQSNPSARTCTGLYDDGVHLGDLCKHCLHGGRRGASARTRSHADELRRLVQRAEDQPPKPESETCYPWLRRYADVLDDLATRLESMTDWLPRATQADR